MQVPSEYHGREQSFLKHRVLREYLVGWGLKLGSVGRNRRVRLCYIDGFAGPWKTKSANLDDTSIAIGLNALEEAAQVWRDKGARVDVEAAFIEKEDSAYADLKQYIDARPGTVKSFTRHGEFGTFVPELQRWLGNDTGLIFVDPTGWKGAAMRFIAPLVAGTPRRDVLVNVMFDHINRFKDDTRAFLRTQMSDFFGLGNSELPDGLDEEQLFALYRAKVKELCRIPHAADLAIPHPTMARTKFRLVVGGKAPEVLSLFRDIEKKVIGSEAAVVRKTAAVREKERRTGQLSLLEAPRPTDVHYDSLHDLGIREAPSALLSKLETKSTNPPAVLSHDDRSARWVHVIGGPDRRGSDDAKPTLFSFGYWGAGSVTRALVDGVNEAEALRGFEPPLSRMAMRGARRFGPGPGDLALRTRRCRAACFAGGAEMATCWLIQ